MQGSRYSTGFYRIKRKADQKPFKSGMRRGVIESCEGKVQYDNPARAQKAMRNRKRFNKPSQAYRCKHCQKWHIAGPASV